MEDDNDKLCEVKYYISRYLYFTIIHSHPFLMHDVQACTAYIVQSVGGIKRTSWKYPPFHVDIHRLRF